MKIQEIAKAHGITESAVKKWSKPKRQQAIRLLSAGVNPQIMELVGEVQRLCYAASMVLGETVIFAYYFDAKTDGYFNIHHFDEWGNRGDVTKHAKMTKETLSFAINKLQSIINV
jgi:predicted transcriptional regulator